MTFLEYVLIKYVGQPTRQYGDGVSYWPCPVCGSESFHTMPNKPEYKHRAKCWSSSCGFQGDAADMLKPFIPDWGDRKERLEQLQREWEQQTSLLVWGRGVTKYRFKRKRSTA